MLHTATPFRQIKHQADIRTVPVPSADLPASPAIPA